MRWPLKIAKVGLEPVRESGGVAIGMQVAPHAPVQIRTSAADAFVSYLCRTPRIAPATSA